MLGSKYWLRGFFAAFFLALAILGQGCRKQPAAAPEPPAQTRAVTDDRGRTVKIPLKINRAISLAPNLTENIFAVGAGDKLVGVTTFCDYPAEAKNIRKIGDTLSPNMESIIALKPEIVFVSTASQMEAFTKTLEENGIAVFVTDPNSLDGILRNLKQLAEIFGTTGRAELLIADIQRRLAAMSEKLADQPQVQVFMQISREPLFTAGKESFVTEMIEHAGGTSVTKDLPTAYPRLSKETALALNPEAIVITAGAGNDEPNDVFKESGAVKNGKVLRIKADLLTRPGPRVIEGLEQMARELHPDKFK
jgi:iron complex transport system substrate-binding protein